MASNRSILEQLPEAIVMDEIGSHLDKYAIYQLRLTSKRLYQLFKEPSQAAKLLYFTQEANYVEAEKIVSADPLLMFKYVSYKKADSTYATISPLKFAFKVLDTYMWKMFYEKIKNNHTALKYFTKQLHEQKEYIDLEPLFREYKIVQDKFNIYEADESYEPAVDEAWLNVGKKQRAIFSEARHILKEFCRKGKLWNIDSKFDVTINPAPISTIVYNHNNESDESLLPFVPNQGLGFDYSVMRGSMGPRCGTGAWCVTVIENDPEIFLRLYEVKMNDLVNFRLQLASLSELERPVIKL